MTTTPPTPRRLHAVRPTRARAAAGVALLATAGLLLSLLAGHSAATTAAEHPPLLAPKRPAHPPNIVVVLTDDMRADEAHFLPAVRRLQRSGVTFSRTVSADSLCCPARATILTGKLAHNHKTIGNDVATHGGYPVFAENNDIHDLLPVWLHDQGYRTSWIGKYLNQTPAASHFDQPGWSFFAVPVHHVYDYRASHFAINGQPHDDEGYRERYTRHLLLQHVKQWSRQRHPFFVLDSTIAPHKTRLGGGAQPPVPQKKYRDSLSPGRLTIEPSVGEIDLSDKPQWLQDYAAKHGIAPYPTRLETHRVEALMSVNDTVHDLVQTLRRSHALKNTVVVFTSDNGFMLREHDMVDKNKAYDESLHIPLVVRGPGFRGGRTVDQTVSLADLTATIRRLAGVEHEHAADGLPLQDVMAHPAAFDRRPVVIEGSLALYPARSQLPTDSLGRFYTGAVWGPYSYIVYQTGDHEFYDRNVDPYELVNTYTPDPPAGSPQALLQAWYEAHLACQGLACNDLIPKQ